MESSPFWRLRTAGGIPYRLVSRTGKFAKEEASGTEVRIIRADDLLSFAAACFPAPTVLPNGRLHYPQGLTMPGILTLPAKDLSWKALVEKPTDPFSSDVAAQAGTYDDYVEVTIEFGTSKENDKERDPDDPKTYLEISSSASAEFVAQPLRNDPDAGPANFWMNAAGTSDEAEVKEADIPNTFFVPATEWTVRWTQLPNEFFKGTLLPKMRKVLGAVNSLVMPSLYDAAVETILFLGYNHQEQYTWRAEQSGMPPIEVTMKFLERNLVADGVTVTHNHVFRPGVGWRKMLVRLQPIYGLSDLEDTLFRNTFEELF